MGKLNKNKPGPKTVEVKDHWRSSPDSNPENDEQSKDVHVNKHKRSKPSKKSK